MKHPLWILALCFIATSCDSVDQRATGDDSITALSSLQDSKALSSHQSRVGDCPSKGGWGLVNNGWDLLTDDHKYPSFKHAGWVCTKEVQSTNPEWGSFISWRDNNLKLVGGSSEYCGGLLVLPTTVHTSQGIVTGD